ncbi:type II toxin-antitoxin system RelE/ParE family toxin [Pectobacterium zantedeschiae]|uniref:Diaminopimelate decarboxylase n=1 Tax=Pectobacterium zantedeschiae TaxID=2034769 RepID=A0A9X8P5Z4_9GAMM|nr:type II toxin-antitoxin system RelE/ParE family toxin [Pectobacterium zantedeschiae]RYC38349.1 diaminopimelate decarboxylase [Pectobacterium zantedeschiae]RYC44994.1 diaminopimelate decarboxylase [Pectobacterium zantedeschiae]
MWRIETTDAFDRWLSALNDIDRACVLAALIVLREKGPMLPRPYADTVKGSRYSNMKELRIQSRGVPIRAFFAFDPHRRGILLCAGNKSGNEKRFYDEMIPFADREFTNYLEK